MAANSEKSGQWSKGKIRLFQVSVLLVSFLLLAYWNVNTFTGGIFAAHPESPDCLRTNAIVSEIDASGGSARKPRENYYITYEYEVAGEEYDNRERVDYNIYNSTKLGAKIEICYMKDHPGRSGIIGNDIKGQDSLWVILVDLGVIALIVFVIYFAIKKRKKVAA